MPRTTPAHAGVFHCTTGLAFANNPPMNPALSQIVRTAQILVAALLFGVSAFAAVALAIGPLQPPPALPPGAAPTPGPFGTLDPLVVVLMALIVGQFPVLIFLGIALAKQAAAMAGRLAGEPDTRDQGLARLWLNAAILRAALAEGAGLFGAVILLVSGDRLGLIGVGFAVIVLMAIMPSRGRLENWIHRAVQTAALAPNRESPRP